MKTCPKCNKQHTKSGTFCSRKCANARYPTEETKKKISIGVLLVPLSIDQQNRRSEAVKLYWKEYREGKRTRQVSKTKGFTKYKTQDILNGLFPHFSTVRLKRRLLDENIKQNKCEICGLIPLWNKMQLVLQLHHIDGNEHNHKLNNLQILCPNCHTQTPNYVGKNVQPTI